MPVLPETVTVLETASGGEAYVIGTAHVSRQSVEDVEKVVEEVSPNTIVVELCSARHESMTMKDRWRNMDVVKVIREGKGVLLMVNLMLSSFQRRIGEKLGVQPGAEMKKGIELARDQQTELVLGDRDVQTTLRRTWGHLSFWEKFRLLFSLMWDSSEEEVSEEELERLKKGDVLSEMLDDMGQHFPSIRERLISERDLWLMDSVYHAPGEKVVAIVGAGHVPGMVEHWGQSVDKAELSTIPTGSSWGWLLLKWGLPLLIIATFIYGFSTQDMGWEVVKVWFLANGVLSALGALIALGHPLSIITAFLAAPFTSLNPTIGAGLVVGLVEAFMRKPKVEDCERLGEDSMTLKGWFRNRITRVLLVMVFSSLCSLLGTYLGAWGVLSLIGFGGEA